MHLQSIKNADFSKHKWFTFRKYPFVQIIGDLKDPDKILTVSLQVIDDKQGLQNTYEQGLLLDRKLSQTIRSGQHYHRLSTSSIKREQDSFREAINEKEKGEIQELMENQFDNQNKSPIEFHLDRYHEKNDSGFAPNSIYVPENDQNGNILVQPGIKLKPQSIKNSIRGEWHLSVSIDNDVEIITIMLNNNGDINEIDKCSSIKKHKINGSYDSEANTYEVSLQGQRQIFKINDDFTEMILIEGDPQPENYFVTKLKKHDPTQVQGANTLAIIKVWTINGEEETIEARKEYHFIDPDITSKPQHGYSIIQIIHKTNDGEAYILQKDKNTNKQTRIFVIDQSWPKNSGPLPIDKENSALLNVDDRITPHQGYISYLSECLGKIEPRPSTELFNQIQFFNQFSYLAITTPHLCQIFSMQHPYHKIKLDIVNHIYKCQIVLAIDKQQKYAYILCKKFMEEKKSRSHQKSYLKKQQSKIKRFDSSDQMEINSFKSKSRQKYAILKFDIQILEEVELFEINSKDAYGQEYIEEAEQNKNKVKCFFDELQDIFILHFLPMKATLVFKLHVTDLLDLHDHVGTSLLLTKVIEKEKSLKVLCREGLIGNQYLSVGPPQIHVAYKDGYVSTEIEMTDLQKDLQPDQTPITIKGAMIQSSYFDNEKLVHAISVTKKNQLIFTAMTRYPETEFKGVHMTAADTGLDDLGQNQQIELEKAKSVARAQSQMSQKYIKSNSSKKKPKQPNALRKYKSKQFIDEFSFEYPVLIYREEEPFKISLCNILQPDEPQFLVNLGKIVVKKFVGGAYLLSQFQTRSLDTNIAMICQNSEYLSQHILMVLSFNPFNKDLLQDAHLYTVAGKIPIPAELQNGRIQQAELLINTFANKAYKRPQKFQNTVIIQFSNCIYACYMSLDSLEDDYKQEKDSYVKQNTKKIVKLKMIRDYNQNIYFAEQESFNRTDIINIYQDPQKKGIQRNSIYFLDGCHILALEKDSNNDQDDRFTEVKKSFFILDNLQRVHYCVKLPKYNNYSAQIISFAQHELSQMSFKRWNSTPISIKTMLYDGSFYSLHTDSSWNRELGNKDHEEDRSYKHVTSFQKVGCQQTVSLDANYSSGSFRFAVQNSPSSKKLLLTETLNASVKQMVFVTDDHILMRLEQKDHLDRRTISNIWRVFNVRKGTQCVEQCHFQPEKIKPQLSKNLFQLANGYELACTDFSNLDDIQKRYVILRLNQDRSQDEYVLYWNEDGEVKHEFTIPKQKFNLQEQVFPIEAVRKDMEMKREEGESNQSTEFYPGCAYSKIDLNLKVSEGGANGKKNLVPFQSNQKANRIFVDISQLKFEKKQVVAAKVTLKKEFITLAAKSESDYAAQISSEAYLVVNDGSSEVDQKQIGKYIIKISNESRQKTTQEFIAIPPTMQDLLSFQVENMGEDKGWRPSDIQLYTENEAIPKQIRTCLLQKTKEATHNFQSWKDKQTWSLNVEQMESIDDYCLPTSYKLPPLIMANKKMIISIGEIDLKKLPHISWLENQEVSNSYSDNIFYFKQPSRTRDTPSHKLNNIKLLAQHQKIQGWDFVNLIVYETQPSKRKIGSILPSQVALIEDTIYMSNVAHPQNKMIKITIHPTKNTSLLPGNNFDLHWTFQISSECPEFSYGDLSAPITINRLQNSWVDKLRKYPEDSKKVAKNNSLLAKRKSVGVNRVLTGDNQTQTQNQMQKKFTNLLQVNHKNQAILFAFHKEEKNGNLYAEEIDQQSNIEDFFSRDHFIPSGFVPTFWKMNFNNNVIKKTVQTNNLEDLYLIQEEEINIDTQEKVSVRYFGPYKMYSEYDLQNVLQLKESCKTKHNIDFDSISRLYNEQNVFSLFFNDDTILEYLQDKIIKIDGEELKMEHIEDQYMEQLEMSPQSLQELWQRRFFINLVTPVNRKSSHYHSNKKSIIKWSFKNENRLQNKREYFLNIALCCPDFSLRHCLSDIDDIIELIQNDTPISKEVLSKAFFTTNQSRLITSLNWNKPQQHIEAFTTNTTFVNGEQVSEKISDPSKQSKIEVVDIKLVNLRWMKQDGKRFCDLVYRFKQLDRPRWFGHELMVSLFQTHWIQTRYFIIKRGLTPFSIYFIFSLLYTTKVVKTFPQMIQIDFTLQKMILFGVPYALSSLYFSYYELVQFKGQFNSIKDKKGCARICSAMSQHFDRLWNFVDVFIMVCVPTIILMSILKKNQVNMPNFDIALIWLVFGNQIAMWFKLFDWLRLFSQTAIYPILLREVSKDIYPFILTMLIILGLFGNSLSIFSSFSVYLGHAELYENRLPSDFLNAVMVQILTMVGEPQFQSFYIEDASSSLLIVLWMWFLMAVLMTNIIFLNVLIAIISDTFERVWEHRQMYILSSQADILCDWINVIEREKDEEKNLYLYMVTRAFQETNDTWEGKVSQIRKLLDAKFKQMQQLTKDNSKKIIKKQTEQTLISENQKNELTLTRNLLVELSQMIRGNQASQKQDHNVQSSLQNAEKLQQQTMKKVENLVANKLSSGSPVDSSPLNLFFSKQPSESSYPSYTVEQRLAKMEINVQAIAMQNNASAKSIEQIKNILLKQTGTSQTQIDAGASSPKNTNSNNLFTPVPQSIAQQQTKQQLNFSTAKLTQIEETTEFDSFQDDDSWSMMSSNINDQIEHNTKKGKKKVKPNISVKILQGPTRANSVEDQSFQQQQQQKNNLISGVTKLPTIERKKTLIEESKKYSSSILEDFAEDNKSDGL